jgi:hypothetical protein
VRARFFILIQLAAQLLMAEPSAAQPPAAAEQTPDGDSSAAVEIAPASSIQSLNPKQQLERLRRAAAGEPRELTVLMPTLAPEEIDRAVLNRLLQDIARQPERVARELDLSEQQIQDMFISLSNSRSFINDNEMAAIRKMCSAYERSTSHGEARIAEALAAYDQRKQFTRDFVAHYYAIVLDDLKATMNEIEKQRFDRYLADRRQRMASTGTVTHGINSQNIASGAESVAFHCRR